MISTSVLARAIAIREDAREHKRLSAFHRRRAQERMDELRRFCQEAGIEYEEVTEGNDAHGQRSEQAH